jgi:glycosyltransferase involved in cell wall biosynthesis
MKILFLNHNLAGRGTYFRCMGFARELVKRGHHVDLWTVSTEQDFQGTCVIEDGVNIWHTPRWGKVGRHDGGYALVDNMARIFAASEGRWDVVHAFDHRPNVLLPWLCLKMKMHCFPGDKTLFVSDWCDWWTAGGITTSRRRFPVIDRIEQRIEEGSKRISDGVTVISSVLQQRAIASGVNPDRLHLLPSGVDIEKFPLLDKNICRKMIGLPEDKPILGFIGFSLWDMELLATAFERVKKQIPQAVLLVIGGGVEESANDIFKQKFKIGADVFLPGVIPFSEAPKYLAACDIQLLPMEDNIANRARLPNKLCDYLASGRPIVASNVGEGGDIVRKNRVGMAVGGGVQKFAEACALLLQNDNLIKEFGRRAREAAITKYSYSRLTDSVLMFYERICK